MSERSARTCAAVVLASVAVTIVTSCDDPQTEEARKARQQYNAALSSLEGAQWEEAEKGLLEARDSAGQDPELRFRAAFNLGIAHAGHAQAKMADAPSEAFEQLQRSIAWFRDAVRLRPDDEDARVNLEVVLRRSRKLADELNKGKNSLEARLDRVIEDQRGLRDDVRKLMARVSAAGAGSEPAGFADDFETAATFERTLLAEANTISELASDELSLLEDKAEEERTDEDKVRLVQLENLEFYMQYAKGAVADARRFLRRLQGDDAHRRADTGLAHLKRAREQLLDPVTVLKGVVEDQTLLLMHTQALEALGRGAIKLQEGEVAKPPPWLSRDHLGDRQQDSTQRTAEVLARFSAGVQAGTASTAPAADPKQERVLAAASEAMVLLEGAVGDMHAALSGLPNAALTDVAEHQDKAIQALIQAIERFAGTRDLIEFVHRDQSQAVVLLTPPDAEEEAGDKAPPPMTTAERMQLVDGIVERNRERLARLQYLLQDDLVEIESKATAQAAEGQQDEQAAEAAKQQLDGERQRYERAEQLRTEADAALIRLDALLDLADAPDAPDAPETEPDQAPSGPLVPTQEAQAHVEELRRLFFSVIEHLKELLQNQTETRDRSASVQAVPPEEQPGRLGPLADAQTRHTAMGDAIAGALEAQADQASAAAQGDPQAGQAAGKLAEAAPEVRSATAQMQEASQVLQDSRELAATTSIDLEPGIGAQDKAIEHLENALRILEPPQQQQQKQQQEQQQQQEEQVSQKQAQRRLQSIRDREAERHKRRRERAQPEPVEKDW